MYCPIINSECIECGVFNAESKECNAEKALSYYLAMNTKILTKIGVSNLLNKMPDNFLCFRSRNPCAKENCKFYDKYSPPCEILTGLLLYSTFADIMLQIPDEEEQPPAQPAPEKPAPEQQSAEEKPKEPAESKA